MTDSIPGDNPPQAAPAPPPPPPPGPPPLSRSTTDRYLAGVCGGLGAHFQVAPVLIRIAFVALTFAGGLGLMLYIAAWALLPADGHNRRGGWNPPSGSGHRNTRLLIAGLITVVAILLFADSVHFAHDGVLWGLGLIAVGALLFVQERQGATAGLATPMPASPAPYAAAVFPTSASTWAPGQQSRPRSILGLATVAAALLAEGVAALLDSAGVVSVTVATGAAIALIVVGAGLGVGTWFGRSRALIVLGVLLLPFTAVAALVDEPLTGGTGNVVVAPQSLAALHGDYHLAAGQLTVDLSQIPSGASPTVTVSVAFGRIVVVVPAQSGVSVTAHAGAGHIDVFGASDDGVNIDSPVSRAATADAGTLHLVVRVGIGQIDVVDPADAPVPVGRP